jgi:hypothetical protein
MPHALCHYLYVMRLVGYSISSPTNTPFLHVVYVSPCGGQFDA